MLVIVLLIRDFLTYGDIYSSPGIIIAGKITGMKSRPVTEIRAIEEAFRHFHFYVEFEDNEKVYFKVNPSLIGWGIENSRSSYILRMLRSKFGVEEKAKVLIEY